MSNLIILISCIRFIFFFGAAIAGYMEDKYSASVIEDSTLDMVSNNCKTYCVNRHKIVECVTFFLQKYVKRKKKYIQKAIISYQLKKSVYYTEYQHIPLISRVFNFRQMMGRNQ